MAKKSKEPTTLPLPISASDDLEDEGPTPYLRADAPASYKSWDTDWARVFRESGPCMVTLRPIGHDLATSIDAKQAELGKARGRTWIACVSEAPMTLRVSYLLKAGFTATRSTPWAFAPSPMAGSVPTAHSETATTTVRRKRESLALMQTS